MSLTEAQKKKIEEEEQYRAEVRNELKFLSLRDNKPPKYIDVKFNRSRSTAAVLAILFGGIGIHKF